MTEESSVNTMMATTMPANQPIMNPTLAPFARGDSNIKITAMIGMGLIAMPTANGRISPITDPIAFLHLCLRAPSRLLIVQPGPRFRARKKSL
jgi:hypothetical protein